MHCQSERQILRLRNKHGFSLLVGMVHRLCFEIGHQNTLNRICRSRSGGGYRARFVCRPRAGQRTAAEAEVPVERRQYPPALVRIVSTPPVCGTRSLNSAICRSAEVFRFRRGYRITGFGIVRPKVKDRPPGNRAFARRVPTRANVFELFGQPDYREC